MRASRRMALYSQGGEPVEFTYSGDYSLTGDTKGDWKIKFLSSGTLSFSKLGNAEDGIDLFIVGGGGGAQASFRDYLNDLYGGASGHGGDYGTHNNIPVAVNTDYPIVIGQGGAGGVRVNVSVLHGENGTVSTAFSQTGNGGYGSGTNIANPQATTEFGDTPETSYSGVGVTMANTGRGGASQSETASGYAGSSGVVVIRNHRA